MAGIELEKDDGFDKTFALKVFTKGREFDYASPWSPPHTQTWTGSGFVIEGRKIITNAHVAGNALSLEVQLAEDSTKYAAKVEAIGHDCDLAILTVDDEEFWDKAKPIPIGDNASQSQKVEAHGFPMGGAGYCVTKGIVSRMERHFYVHGETEHFIYQIDAAINPGNSGGAVISKNAQTGEPEVVGVAHQGMSRGQNIAYMIPSAVLKHFVAQVEKEEMGFPGLAIKTQSLGNKYMRDKYGLKKGQTGVLVNQISDLSCAQGRLKKGDILLSIDDIPIKDDGSVRLKAIKKVDFKYIINNKHLGETIEFKILRDGEIVTERVKLKNKEGSTRLVIPMEYDKAPTYYVLGGLIPVQPVTKNYMYATKNFYRNKHKKHMSDELLVINRILTKDDYTQGYSDNDFAGELIYSVNGIVVHTMQDLIRAAETNIKPTHTIVTKYQGELSEIVIPNLNVAERNEVLKLNGLPSDRSDDLISETQKQEKLLEELMQTAGKTLTFSKRAKTKATVSGKENVAPAQEPSANDDALPPARSASAPSL